MPRFAAAFSVKRRIKGQYHKTSLCQFVGIYTRPLLFHAAVRRADHQSGMAG